MKKSMHIITLVIFFMGILPNGWAVSISEVNDKEKQGTQTYFPELPPWALGHFVRPEKGNPVIEPNPESTFFCPMHKSDLKWEESDTFNPCAIVKDNKINVLYRAEDNTAQGIGLRSSRIGLAVSKNGLKMKRFPSPIFYPAEDNMKIYEWPGGCEDPRIVVSENGTYVMTYHAWDRKLSRLCVATSKDLKTWVKHGHVFEKAYDGKFTTMWTKATSIVTKVVDGKMVASKINGKYFMYWGEHTVYAAYSDDLINWTPVVDNDGNLKVMIKPRDGYFDSHLTECGPPAVLTENGIVLIYNGRNSKEENRDKRFVAGTYSAGQALFDTEDPSVLLDRLDVPFFKPEADYEKSGQYVEGTVFVEGMVFFKKKWYLYYGCADSKVGVAIYDPGKSNKNKLPAP
jgi:beta-1,2-mannosidase